MKRNIVIMLVLFSLVFSSPALAVKKVAKADNGQTSEQPRNDSGGQQTPVPEKAAPPVPAQPEINRAPEQPSRPERPSKIEKDSFIDEDDDGINDRLKAHPETVKKEKKTDRSEQERSKQDQSEKRSEKKTRSR